MASSGIPKLGSIQYHPEKAKQIIKKNTKWFQDWANTRSERIVVWVVQTRVCIDLATSPLVGLIRRGTEGSVSCTPPSLYVPSTISPSCIIRNTHLVNITIVAYRLWTVGDRSRGLCRSERDFLWILGVSWCVPGLVSWCRWNCTCPVVWCSDLPWRRWISRWKWQCWSFIELKIVKKLNESFTWPPVCIDPGSRPEWRRSSYCVPWYRPWWDYRAGRVTLAAGEAIRRADQEDRQFLKVPNLLWVLPICQSSIGIIIHSLLATAMECHMLQLPVCPSAPFGPGGPSNPGNPWGPSLPFWPMGPRGPCKSSTMKYQVAGKWFKSKNSVPVLL